VFAKVNFYFPEDKSRSLTQSQRRRRGAGVPSFPTSRKRNKHFDNNKKMKK